MSLRVKLEIAAAVLVVLLGGIGLFAYQAERENRIRAEATQQAEATIIKQAQDDRAQHVKEDAARDAATAATLETMQKALANLKTPQQQVTWSQQQLEDAIKGIKIVVSPTGEATATIPAASIPELPQVIAKCQECGIKLATSQADLASRDAQMKLADEQIQALKKDNSSLQVAVKGGTVLQRTLRVMKYLAIGAVAGYVAGRKF